MKTFIQITFWSSLFLVSGSSIIAQQKIEISTDPPAAAISLPVVKQVGKAKVMYSERKDETISQTAFLLVSGESLDGIMIQAGFTSAGKKPVTPKVIMLRISPAAKDRTYVDDRTFKLLLNGKEMLSGTTRFLSANTDGRIVVASLAQDISYELFADISRAHKVRMQVGQTTFDLKDSDLAAFRDLLKCIE
jgi:hypothetical protein